MNNTKITTTDLDFDAIKANLKSYLQSYTNAQGDPVFTGHNFEGSGLSLLLDVLAYNTHYNALYTNLAINEAFLDSASKRNSVVSRAQDLGYVPRSARCSTATVQVVMTYSGVTPPDSVQIPANTPFTGQIGGNAYTFLSAEAVTATNDNDEYTFPDILIREGTQISNSYTYTDGTVIILPNTGADISTLFVTVQENSESATVEVFNPGDLLIDIGPDDPVFFIKELDEGLYKIEFGNGVVGKPLVPGNIITLTYIVGSKSDPNGITSFTYGGQPLAGMTVTTSTVDAASNGDDPEDIDSIRANAPFAYVAQNRCVTAVDYETAIKSSYTDVKAVNVWGGENNIPPEYGKVFVSIVPNTVNYLSEAQKEYILNTILYPRKSLTSVPVIVDPEYLNIHMNVSYYYNPQLTTLQASDITSLVHAAIVNYNNTQLNQFGKVFKFSKISSIIDNIDPSITGNITTLKLYKEITPIFNASNDYVIDLHNPIYNSGVFEESVRSSGFYVSEFDKVCYFEDSPELGSTVGDIKLFYYNTSGQKISIKTIGTIDYSAGIIRIRELNITSLYAGALSISVKPQSNDVVSLLNQFVVIDINKLVIKSVVDYPDKPKYTFTSSRT